MFRRCNVVLLTLIFAYAYFCPCLFLLKRRQLLAIGEEFGAFLVVDAIDAEHLAAHETGGCLLADGNAEYALVEGGHLGRVEAVILGAGREGAATARVATTARAFRIFMGSARKWRFERWSHPRPRPFKGLEKTSRLNFSGDRRLRQDVCRATKSDDKEHEALLAIDERVLKVV
jgi:hypothetical protein